MSNAQNNDGFEMPARDEEAEMAAARKAMAGFGKPSAKAAAKYAAKPVGWDTVDCGTLGPFKSPTKAEETNIVWRQFVGAGGTVPR
jgi:hypothetical protein